MPNPTVDIRTRSKSSANNYRYAIVGAGVGGLGTALGLLDRGVPGSDICIISDRGEPGGRLVTRRTVDHSVAELGAARYSPQLHPRLQRLMRRFNIASKSHEYLVNYANVDTGFDPVTDREWQLMATSPSSSFIDAANRVLGASRAHAVIDASGYEAIREPHFPVLGGIDLVRSHPESISSKGFQHQWRSPRGGFEELATKMADYVSDAGVDCWWNVQTRAMTETDDGVEMVTFFRNRPSTVTADNVVLAISPKAAARIDHPYGDKTKVLDKMVDVPLFKAFVTYDRNWWAEKGLSGTCLIAGNELQKVYFAEDHRTIHFYCDSANSTFWSHANYEGSYPLQTAINEKLSSALGFKPDAQIVEIVARDWECGISYWSHTAEPDFEGSIALSTRSVLISDALTSANGWIEGSIEAAEQAVAFLKVPAIERAISL